MDPDVTAIQAPIINSFEMMRFVFKFSSKESLTWIANGLTILEFSRTMATA